MRFEYIFWDWNGTLLDDAHIAHSAVNAMLSARKLNKISFSQYRDYVDVPIIRFYERVMDISKESMEDIAIEFNSLCQSLTLKDPLAKNAKALLGSLNAAGVKQYIFSSSKTERILPALREYGIDKYFASVLGANDSFAGSKAERTRDFIQSNSINPKKCLFIGDLVHDCETASLCGGECVLLSYGHQSKTKLLETGKRVFDSLLQLSEFLNINLQEAEQ